MEIVEEITLSLAKKKLYSTKPTYGFILKTLSKSGKLYKARICKLEEFKNILLFPWNDWGLSYRKERRFNNQQIAYSMRLGDVVSNYHEFRQEILKKDIELFNDGRQWLIQPHSNLIEDIKRGTKERKRINNDWDIFVLRQKDDNLYLIDGHHRLIAFLDLIQENQIAFNYIKIILADFNDIQNYIQGRREYEVFIGNQRVYERFVGGWNVLPIQTWNQ